MTTRLPQLAETHDCTGCMACVASCKVSALKIVMGEDGHAYPRLDVDLCVNCLHCENVCKTSRTYVGNNELKLSTPYAVWANDEQLRSNSTSGEFSAAVNRWFTNQFGGGISVFFDGRKAKHIHIKNSEEINRVQGSKYVWSDASEAYKQIAKVLPNNKVLFTGTGCQVAGVLAFFAKHPNRENLYTIDLICGGVPSDLLMQSYMDNNPKVEAITSFRTKRQYELKGIVAGKEVTLPIGALPIAGFKAEQTNRYVCYDCPFAKAHRCSDITIGDLWGTASPTEERSKGVSLVVVHSAKGQEMLVNADVTAERLNWRDILNENKRLVYGHTPKIWLRRKLAVNYQKMNSARFARIYSLMSSPSDPFGFSARVLNYLLKKIDKVHCRRVIKKVLHG